MTRNIALVTIAFSLTLGIAARSEAQDESYSSATGAYVSLGGTYANENLDKSLGGKNRSRNLDRVSDVSDTGGIRFALGVQDNAWSAFEAQFAWLNGFEFDARKGGSGGNAVRRDLDIYSVQWNAKLFPLFWLLDDVLQGRIQPYLVGGPGLLAASNSGLSTPLAFALQGGGGVKVHITKRLALEADATYMFPANENLEGLEYVAVTGALVYRFGD